MLFDAIRKANNRAGKILFPLKLFESNSKEINEILSDKNSIYLGHGGDCICFSYDDDYVLKLCIKRDKSNYEVLKYKSDEANSKNINFAPVVSVLFQDHIAYIYKQVKCSIIEKLSLKDLLNIFDIWINMIDCNIISHDIYYRNFGYYKDTMHIFDFHEKIVERVGEFDISNMIINILCCFRIPKYNNFLSGIRYTIESYENSNFSFDYQIPPDISTILVHLNKLRKVTDKAQYIEQKKWIMPIIRSAHNSLVLKSLLNSQIIKTAGKVLLKGEEE